MSVLNQAHDLLDQFAEPVQHAALWLVGAYTATGKEIAVIEAEAPFVKEATQFVVDWAKARNIPIDDLAQVGNAVVGLAQKIADTPIVKDTNTSSETTTSS